MNLIPESTIEEFAEANDLTMSINERDAPLMQSLQLKRYWCQFKNSNISEPGVLVGKSGNGDTPEEAIADYAKEISEQRLVVDAYTDSRREIKVPRLIPGADQ